MKDYIAIDMVEKFDKNYSFEERKILAVKSVDMVIAEVMKGKTYDGIQHTFDKLNKLKKEIRGL